MLNNWSGTGRITADPEIRNVGEYNTCSFHLAINRDYKDKDGNVTCDFIPVRAWNASAEYLAKYANKGDVISVSGRFQIDRYEDKDGETRYSTYINATNIYIIGATAKKEDTGETRKTNKSNRKARRDW